MQLLIIIFGIAGILALLRFFGQAIIVAIAAILTPFLAAWRWRFGPKSNQRNNAIIALAGLFWLACIIILSALLTA